MKPLAGKRVVLTGTIDGFSRDELRCMAESLGASVSGSVHRGVDLVIAGPGAGSKLKKARELDIRVIEREEWLTIVAEAGEKING